MKRSYRRTWFVATAGVLMTTLTGVTEDVRLVLFIGGGWAGTITLFWWLDREGL